MKPIDAYYADKKTCRACRTEQRKAWVAANPEKYRAAVIRKRKKENEQRRQRYAADPEFRERIKAAGIRLRAKKRKRRMHKEAYQQRYRNDPEFRERELQRHRERYAADPAFAADMRDKARARRAAKRREKQNTLTPDKLAAD